jgi:effector-binding domain-containing protein
LSSLPAGTVAYTRHRGQYEGIPNAHRAIIDWAGREGRTLAGPRWEIYGHWRDNPDELHTEVYYLLAE